MAQINLLPTDLAPKASIIKASGTVKKTLSIGFFIFILMAIGIGAFFIFYSKELKTSKAKVAELQSNIKALEKTEQRLLLVKDRLDKAKQVLGSATASDEIDNAYTLISSLQQDVGLVNADFKEEETNITFFAPNTVSMSQTVKTITTLGLYTGIDMKSFNFVPEQGFLLSFKLLK